VVPGRLEASSLTDGKKLRREGEELTSRVGSTVTIVDAKAALRRHIPNVNQSNG